MTDQVPAAPRNRTPLASRMETLERRQLLTVALNSAVTSPLSSTPAGDPAAPILADFDRDGKLDVVVAYPSPSAIQSGYLQFGKGDGAGAFAIAAPVDIGIFRGLPVVGDFNGDSNLDLAVTNPFEGQIKVLAGNGVGSFATPQVFSAGVSPEALAVGDLNGDALADLVIGNRSNDTVQIRLGNAGTLLGDAQSRTTGLDPATVATGDFNGDGKVDVLVGSAGKLPELLDSGVFDPGVPGELELFTGNGDGTFATSPIVTAGPRGVTAVADINRDGLLDVITGVSDRDRADALLNNGNGTFTLTRGSTGESATKVAVAADIGEDNLVDLVSALAGRIDVLEGLGNGAFARVVSFDAAGGSGPAVGDVNGDGRPDVLTVKSTEGVASGRTLNVSIGQRIGPDLSVAAVTQTPASLVSGSTQKFVVRVNNLGNAPLRNQPTLLQLYASDDGATIDDGDVLLAETTKRLTIKAGGGKNVQLKFALTAPIGSYTLITRVDPNAVLTDLDRSNNAAAASTQTAIADPFVDLAAAFAVPPAGSLPVGSLTTIDVVVTNNGNVNAKGKTVNALTASTDGSSDSADTLLKSLTTSMNIKPSQTKTLRFKFRVPQGLSGSQFLIAEVNSTATIAETVLGNNTVVSVSALPIS